MSAQESIRPDEILARLKKLREQLENLAASEKDDAEPDAVELALEGEDDLLQTGLAWLKEEIRQTKHLHIARLVLLGGLSVLTLLWVTSIIVFLWLTGMKSITSFNLSDKVLMTYITSTTVSVLGLFGIAARWLFSAQSFLNRAKPPYPRQTKES